MLLLIKFGLVSALLVIIAAIFIVPVLVAFSQTGEALRFPTLIVCGVEKSAFIILFILFWVS